MIEYSYKEKLSAFKNSCRAYKNEKVQYSKMLDQIDRGQIEKDFGIEQCLIFMKEDIDFVESSFDRIMESSGSHAKVILWNLFVDEKTQQQVADEFGITRRQLQYSMNKWLHALLGQS